MYPPIRNNVDARALERTPLSELLAATNAFEAVRQAAEAHPDNVALKLLVPGDPDALPREITYRSFLASSYHTANMLTALGLEPDAVVSFLLPLRPEAYYTILGGEAAGIVNAVNPLLEDWQIEKILVAAGTRILVAPGPAVSEEIWSKVAALRDRLPELRAVVAIGGGDGDGVHEFSTLIAEQPDDHLISARAIQPSDIASYFHTGGTTGTPKLAQHTHYMQAMQIWSTGATFGLTESDVLLAGLPLFHIGGSIVTGLVPLAHGATLVVVSPAGWRDPNAVKDIWRTVHHHRVSILGAVPTVLGASLNIPTGNADLSSIRFAATGGSALPVEVGRALYERIKAPVLEGYGMTETTSYVTFPPRDGSPPLGAVGIAMPHCEVKVVSLGDDGKVARECEVDEIGLVVIRGASVTPGYVQSEYNASAWLEDGWLNSGDLGRLDAEGQLWVTGRAKDLIIRGGHNIDPAVIEEALHEHPAVELAAAVGKPDAYAGELPIAYVQLKPQLEARPEDLQAFARGHIPERAANPVEVYLLDQMPLTAVGKIFKPALRWDAMQRVFSERLEPMANEEGLTCRVGVAADDRHGALTTVTLSGGPRE